MFSAAKAFFNGSPMVGGVQAIARGIITLATLLTASVPEFRIPALILMVAGGIGGGIVGRKLNKKMDNKAVDKLFIGLMVLIVAICVYNAVRAFIG